jgi:hypothetical protein
LKDTEQDQLKAPPSGAPPLPLDPLEPLPLDPLLPLDPPEPLPLEPPLPPPELPELPPLPLDPLSPPPPSPLQAASQLALMQLESPGVALVQLDSWASAVHVCPAFGVDDPPGQRQLMKSPHPASAALSWEAQLFSTHVVHAVLAAAPSWEARHAA